MFSLGKTLSFVCRTLLATTLITGHMLIALLGTVLFAPIIFNYLSAREQIASAIVGALMLVVYFKLTNPLHRLLRRIDE